MYYLQVELKNPGDWPSRYYCYRFRGQRTGHIEPEQTVKEALLGNHPHPFHRIYAKNARALEGIWENDSAEPDEEEAKKDLEALRRLIPGYLPGEGMPCYTALSPFSQWQKEPSWQAMLTYLVHDASPTALASIYQAFLEVPIEMAWGGKHKGIETIQRDFWIWRKGTPQNDLYDFFHQRQREGAQV